MDNVILKSGRAALVDHYDQYAPRPLLYRLFERDLDGNSGPVASYEDYDEAVAAYHALVAYQEQSAGDLS